MEHADPNKVPGVDGSLIELSCVPRYTVGYSRSLYETFMPLCWGYLFFG